MEELLLNVQNLKTYFYTEEGVVPGVDDVSFSVRKGETLAIVGESGCGKSATALSILRIVQSPPGRIIDGQILFGDKDLLKLSEKEMRDVRGNDISMIFQEPMTSLNPVFTVGEQISQPLRFHQNMNKKQARERAVEMIRLVGIADPERVYSQYPHQCSGGQRQRIGVARALALNPDLLICDEPVSALDVSIQAQILNLMEELQEKYSLTYVFVSHNLSVVKHLCDRIVVMYLGNIVEISDSKDIYKSPLHPYTIALINAIPLPDPKLKRKLVPLEGDVPSPVNPPQGCPFVTRCPHAKDICGEVKPKLADTGNGHQVACHMFDGK
ncbi:ABC transporter ATP-binding protein [Lachnospiraceae bacterium 45-P1]